jgi:aryl-alcohol dehydrogenase-like predicted oxidoreductase
MRKIQLGARGPQASVIGLLCAAAECSGPDDTVTSEAVEAALDAGITLLDFTADSEARGHAEEALGPMLRGRRESVTICTAYGDAGGVGQVARGRARYRYIRSSLEDSLRRLGTDYIDVYNQYLPDDALPLEEMLYTLQRLIGEGKIRNAGVAYWESWRYLEACSIAYMAGLAGLCSFRLDYSLLADTPNTDLVAACHQHGTGVLAANPFAVDHRKPGWLGSPEAWTSGSDDGKAAGPGAALAEFARQTGHHVRDLAISGLVAQPEVSAVLVPATSASEVRGFASAANHELTSDEAIALAAVIRR